MKKCFVLLSCLVLAGAVFAAQDDNPKKEKKKAAAHPHNVQQHNAHQNAAAVPGNRRATQGYHRYSAEQGVATQGVRQQQFNAAGHHHMHTQTNVSTNAAQQHVAVQRNVNRYHARQFTLASRANPEIANVRFSAGRHIHGAENWQGQHYAAFRNYHSEWHDRDWWHHHHNRVVFVFGAPYYWNAGWWYPAWGYDPNASYAYDGPIYGYNDLPPDQVVANVQAALQEQGYYTGEVDGLLGPLTRAALARYQEDHGLYATEAIDQPTLEALGMS